MPIIVSDHQVFAPHDLMQALQFAAEHRDEGWRPVAGGTDVMRRIYGNRADAKRWISLAPLRDELAGIHDDCGRIRVGSLTTMTELRQSAVLHDVCRWSDWRQRFAQATSKQASECSQKRYRITISMRTASLSAMPTYFVCHQLVSRPTSNSGVTSQIRFANTNSFRDLRPSDRSPLFGSSMPKPA